MRTIGVFLVLFTSLAALGEGPAPDPWKVCYADMDRFCPGTPKNEGSAIRCLMPNEEKLSRNCMSFFLARKREALKDWPCAEDAEKLCKDVVKDVGAVGACLLKQRAKLSPKCREFHDAAAQKLREHQKKIEKTGNKMVTPDGIDAPTGSSLPVPK